MKNTKVKLLRNIAIFILTISLTICLDGCSGNNVEKKLDSDNNIHTTGEQLESENTMITTEETIKDAFSNLNKMIEAYNDDVVPLSETKSPLNDKLSQDISEILKTNINDQEKALSEIIDRIDREKVSNTLNKEE